MEHCDNCRPFGETLDLLGVKVHVTDDGFAPLDTLVLVKGVDSDGEVGLKVGWSAGQDWITRRGLLESVLDLERTGPQHDYD